MQELKVTLEELVKSSRDARVAMKIDTRYMVPCPVSRSEIQILKAQSESKLPETINA